MKKLKSNIVSKCTRTKIHYNLPNSYELIYHMLISKITNKIQSFALQVQLYDLQKEPIPA